jgi:hypothetical protein
MFNMNSSAFFNPIDERGGEMEENIESRIKTAEIVSLSFLVFFCLPVPSGIICVPNYAYRFYFVHRSVVFQQRGCVWN